jgi:hypothetical protein
MSDILEIKLQHTTSSNLLISIRYNLVTEFSKLYTVFFNSEYMLVFDIESTTVKPLLPSYLNITETIPSVVVGNSLQFILMRSH